MIQLLTADNIGLVLDELAAAGATATREADQYENPIITIKGAAERPVLERHSVIGGEEIVGLTASGDMFKVPFGGHDPFGPIDDASEQIAQLWPLVTARFPAAG
ncbi:MULTISPECIES: hypothetical protein [Mycolicibacter]|uniref:Uncharacterized protein n=2 Tax=Mycolicibacter TaxID=1073531 RepID=A0ABU5XQI5_9MYCO|nr:MULTISPECIES: hypothetical protein [unclassified Mycolicibacter]MEB3023351.1 hypothetical protein [Mycolicibacter sp. MYC098]MEB3033692.1 hypothetical protein [Mycolicibacter sp. MYC340]